MDKKTEQSIKNYNKIAVEYDNTFDGKFTQGFKAEIAKVIHLEKSYKVLDVACGNGSLLQLLSSKAKQSFMREFTFHLGDSSAFSVGKAKERGLEQCTE